MNAVGGVMRRCLLLVKSKYSDCFAEDDESVDMMQSNGILKLQPSSNEHEQGC